MVAALTLTHAASGAILKQWDFEGADPFRDLKLEGETPTVVVDPVAPNNHAMVSVLRPASERSERSEVRWDRVGYGVERWCAVRILVPEANPQRFMSIFQLGPIRNPKKDDGRGWFQLQMLGPEQAWLCRLFLERVSVKGVRTQLSPVALGRWETWVMHFRLANDQSGFFELWQNGKSIYKNTGPNATPGDAMPIKWGVYIGIGSKLKKEMKVLYDDVVLGDEKSSLAEVSLALHLKEKR